jgi:LDH2 family malate/lactate/ureidoglycolate dehydrogenase
MQTRVVLSTQEAKAISIRYLMSLGYSKAESETIAQHTLRCAMQGYEYSGLPKLINIKEHLQKRGFHRPTNVIFESEISMLIDGGNQNGMLAVSNACDLMISKIKTQGIYALGLHNIWMSGRSFCYMETLARAGYVGFHAVRSRPQVAPIGGIKATMGTNPISFGFPNEPHPLIVDLGTSAVMMTDVMYRHRNGQKLEENVAIDQHGNITTDPAQALLGAALPFGGHKGFALSIAMTAFGILAGAADDVDQSGYFLLAFKPELFMPLEKFKAELDKTLKMIRQTPRLDTTQEIRIPSEQSFKNFEHALKHGIEVDRWVYEELSQ